MLATVVLDEIKSRLGGNTLCLLSASPENVGFMLRR